MEIGGSTRLSFVWELKIKLVFWGFLFFRGRASERRREKTKDGMRHISFFYLFYFIFRCNADGQELERGVAGREFWICLFFGCFVCAVNVRHE